MSAPLSLVDYNIWERIRGPISHDIMFTFLLVSLSKLPYYYVELRRGAF